MKYIILLKLESLLTAKAFIYRKHFLIIGIFLLNFDTMVCINKYAE